tara:strand:- start:55 stop:2664 length:2610 start_codon:yes stop_codon:yes gene_type:complete
MKVYPRSNIHFIRRAVFSIYILISLTGCSIFYTAEKTVGKQPANFLLQEMDKQHLASPSQLFVLFKNPNTLKELPTQTKQALKKHPDIAADLLLAMNKSPEPQQNAMKLIENRKDNQREYIYVALTLYPIDGYRFADKLSLSDKITIENITTASLRAGFDPALIFPATAASDEDYRIVPLMQSASITLYNQTQYITADIQFKEQAGSDWLYGLALQWEPIQGALSGSIVYLQPDTDYQVKVSRYENSELISEQEYSFKTRAESPPIDPEKIYYLSDIYQDGQLNLETLGIEGSESGWAKIIGDGVTVKAGSDDLSAIHIGSQNYIMLENVTTTGGERFGIHGYKAHHIWIKGCDVSAYGRVATEYRDGIGYAGEEYINPINYDSGIYLERSGIVVIEDCEIYSPNGKANSWEVGHPNGPNAFQIWGKHDTEAYRGQYIVRNNRFYGAPDHRFNDVIEGRGNRDRNGGFGRDSAIYNNYLAFANDDLIEIDGGQANVLVYNNEMTQGYCGISTAPNMIGPSYVFHNYIHDLGDERGKEWAAIKMGGLMSSPSGLTNIFENIIVTNRNGITASRVDNDYTFWVNALNNIIITREHRNMVGYGIYDKQFYEGSVFKNNVIYNVAYGAPFVQATVGENFYHPWSEKLDKIDEAINSGSTFKMEIESRFLIPNFTLEQLNISETESNDEKTIYPFAPSPINFNGLVVSSFDNQDSQKSYQIMNNNLGITLSGNTWKAIEYEGTLTLETVVEVDLTHNGSAEIIGISFETDNKLSPERLFKFFGSQRWDYNVPVTQHSDTTETLTFNIGQYITGPINRLVFVLDNDHPVGQTQPQASFENIKIYEPSTKFDIDQDNYSHTTLGPEDAIITIGIAQ